MFRHTDSLHPRFPLVLFLFVLLFPSLPLRAFGQDGAERSSGIPEESALYLTVELDPALKVSMLKPGDIVEGKLARDVYWGDRELFPAASRVRMTVDKLGRRRRIPNDHWPWIVKLFTPRREHYPTFRLVTVFLSDGVEAPLSVSSLSMRNEMSVRVQPKAPAERMQTTNNGAVTSMEAPSVLSISTPPKTRRGAEKLRLILTLRAAVPTSGPFMAPQSDDAPVPNYPTEPVTIQAGTRARVILLNTLSASKSRPGETFRARVIEPVQLGSVVVLPEGTLIEGKVAKRTPPRMLSRAGSLQLTFTRLVVSGGESVPLMASLTEAELDRRSHTKIDPEGMLRGDKPGKAWWLINLGVTAGTAKEADDAAQLIIEAIVFSATDALTAGVGRIVGSCASGLFFLTRHGRDVVLPEFTEMTITFDRQVSLSASH